MFGVLKAENMKYYATLTPVVNAVNDININIYNFIILIFDTIFLYVYIKTVYIKLNINITPITKHILYKSECHLHTRG